VVAIAVSNGLAVVPFGTFFSRQAILFLKNPAMYFFEFMPKFVARYLFCLDCQFFGITIKNGCIRLDKSKGACCSIGWLPIFYWFYRTLTGEPYHSQILVGMNREVLEKEGVQVGSRLHQQNPSVDKYGRSKGLLKKDKIVVGRVVRIVASETSTAASLVLEVNHNVFTNKRQVHLDVGHHHHETGHTHRDQAKDLLDRKHDWREIGIPLSVVDSEAKDHSGGNLPSWAKFSLPLPVHRGFMAWPTLDPLNTPPEPVFRRSEPGKINCTPNSPTLFPLLPTVFGIWIDGWNMQAYMVPVRVWTYAAPYEVPIDYLRVFQNTGRVICAALSLVPFGIILGKAAEILNECTCFYIGSQFLQQVPNSVRHMFPQFPGVINQRHVTRSESFAGYADKLPKHQATATKLGGKLRIHRVSAEGMEKVRAWSLRLIYPITVGMFVCTMVGVAKMRTQDLEATIVAGFVLIILKTFLYLVARICANAGADGLQTAHAVLERVHWLREELQYNVEPELKSIRNFQRELRKAFKDYLLPFLPQETGGYMRSDVKVAVVEFKKLCWRWERAFTSYIRRKVALEVYMALPVVNEGVVKYLPEGPEDDRNTYASHSHHRRHGGGASHRVFVPDVVAHHHQLTIGNHMTHLHDSHLAEVVGVKIQRTTGFAVMAEEMAKKFAADASQMLEQSGLGMSKQGFDSTTRLSASGMLGGTAKMLVSPVYNGVLKAGNIAARTAHDVIRLFPIPNMMYLAQQ